MGTGFHAVENTINLTRVSEMPTIVSPEWNLGVTLLALVRCLQTLLLHLEIEDPP
jgi:hypothetical protein